MTETLSIAKPSIVFFNDGELDIRCAKVMGVSVKEGPNPVGYFGTGLKYAISVLLRNGCTVRILSGANEYKFETSNVRIRGQDFKLITCNGEELSYTTELGKKWEPWQAYRELYCNAIDEAGSVFKTEGEKIYPREGKTSVIVEGVAIMEAHLDRDNFILSSQPLEANAEGEIHPGRSRFVFYRGVRALTLPYETKYTYNITKQIDLSEDRLIKWTWEAAARLGNIIGLCAKKEIIRDTVCPGQQDFEDRFDYDYCKPSRAFEEVIREESNKCNRGLHLGAKRVVIKESHDIPLENNLAELQDHDRQRIKTAIDFCKKAGFPVDDYEIIYVKWLGQGVMGQAKDDKIYIAYNNELRGTRGLVETLIEEYIHLRFDLQDSTRAMQNWLLTALVDKLEIIHKKVL